MATSNVEERSFTVEEYVRFEDASPERHEYVAGRVYAMTGGSARHNAIALDVVDALRSAARGGPCRTFASDLRLRVAADAFYYPDVMAVCGPIDMEARVVEAPSLVVEVASPSTRRIDRGEKLLAYRAIETLRLYLIVEQDQRLVERHWRDGAGAWQHESVTDAAGGRIPVSAPSTILTLDAIYEGVDVPPAATTGGPRRVREG
jgi:Uma2 family endonuclease